MKNLVKLAAAAVLGAGMLAATSASAAIVCNAAGECWHVHRAWGYPPESGIVVHPNGWVAAPGAHVIWREHPGRGYWRGGVWVRF